MMTHSQIGQDLFVLRELQEKRGGFFVEIGGHDGVTHSNTYLLEKEYEWDGIVVEPAKCFRTALESSRNCTLDFRAVWGLSREALTFKELPGKLSALSTLEHYRDCDHWAMARAGGESYTVVTVSLTDLLKQHKAPWNIDYISIDTEGAEFDILGAFDFDAFNVKIFTIEHNFTPKREAIYALMTSKGYERKHETASRWDDWFIRSQEAPPSRP